MVECYSYKVEVTGSNPVRDISRINILVIYDYIIQLIYMTLTFSD